MRAPIADKQKVNELAKPLFEDAKEFGGGSLYDWGTAGGVSGAARGGWLPIKNYTTSVFDEHEQVGGQYIRGHFEWKNNPCWACQMACCKTMTVTEGPYAGYSGEEPEYEGMASMGAQIGVTEAGAASTWPTSATPRVGHQRARLAAGLGDRVLQEGLDHQGAARRARAALGRPETRKS